MGDRQEREMVNTLEEAGHGALRLAASGGGGDHDLPDVFCCIDGNYYAIEEKYRSAKSGHTRCYVDAEEVEALVRFADRWNAAPALAVRYSTRCDGVSTADHFIAHPTDVPRTDTGRYKLHHSIAVDWPTFGDVV